MIKITTTAGLVVALGLTACSSVGMRRSLVRTAPVCEDVTAPIYFEANQAQLTRDGRRVIAMAAANAQGCTVQSVKVMGLADAAGESAANLELSKRRAASVTDALLRAKLPPAEFAVAAAGDAGAITKAGANQPLRRRADIILKLAKPKT